ncbi:hypothetical protein [Vulcanococcus limneticus]|uniref:hypothetical protein n=1 Tax=Vulcanococcus limneticus TaxID=2170428 RepID=UPI00398C20D5
MTTWTFGTAGSGLNFVVTIDDSGAASVHMIEGSMDLNALWFSDGDSLKEGDTSLTNNLSSLKMTGAGSVDADGNTITWDEMTRLSTVGLGSAGTTKITFLTAGETQSITLDAGSLAFLESQESLADITLGIRATSVNGTGGIKLNAEADPFVDTTAPTFSQGGIYSFNYKETVDANAVVAEITTATDNVGVTQYRFVSADGQTVIGSTTEDGFFSINNSGKVSITDAGWDDVVAQYGSGEGDQHTYYVQAGDAKDNWSSAQQITLNELDDKPPVFNQGVGIDYSFNYNENNVANDVVAEITSTLVGDNSGVVTQFRFVSTDGQTIYGARTSDGYFSIDSTGKISIKYAGAAAAVNDIQTQTSHTYLLQAGDAQGNWSSSQTITLNAVDSTAPAFSQDADYSFSYRENQRVDGLVADISSTVSDKVGVTQYRFVSFDGEVIHGDISEDGYFSIDSSGKITMTAAGVGSAVNDFETLTDPSTDGLADFSFALPNFFQPIFFEPLPLEPTYYVQAGDTQGNWSSVQEIALSELDLFISVDGKGDATNPGRAWYDDNQDGVLDEGETSISKTVVDENYQKQNSIFNGTTSYTLDGVDFATDDIRIKAWQLDGGCLDLHGFTSDDRIELDLANMVDAYGQKTGNQAVRNVVGTVASDSQGLIKTLLVENLKAPTASRPAGTGSVYMVADWGQPTSGRAIGAINVFNNEQNAVCVFGYNTSDVSTVVSQDQIIVSWPEFT